MSILFIEGFQLMIFYKKEEGNRFKQNNNRLLKDKVINKK
jgi:hypothetical protein